ncbi:unnamed protein product [Symbiodinium sp. CCMP2592]|nr:unnamed protein product [Symbiodinium sp. CCMP2592]
MADGVRPPLTARRAGGGRKATPGSGLAPDEMLREPVAVAPVPVEPLTRTPSPGPGPGTPAALAIPEDFEDPEALKQTLGVVNRRQEEWQRQLQSVDEKQAELAHIQWKLVRDQSSSLAKELAIVQTQLKDLKVESRRALVECERAFRENEAKLNEERSLRLAMFESLELRMKKARADLETETRERAATETEVAQKIKALNEELITRSREQQAADLQHRRLREDLKVSLEDLDALKQTVCQEMTERREGEETLSQIMREVRESVLKETQSRTNSEEAMKDAFQQTLEQERTDRIADVAALRTASSALQKDVTSLKEVIPNHRARLGEVEHFMNTRLKEIHKGLEDELQKRAAADAKLEKNLKDLSSSLETEVSTRQSLAEEVDQVLKTMKSKMKSSVAEQAEIARQALETAKKQFTEQLASECHMREAVTSKLSAALEEQRGSLLSAVERLEMLVRSADQRWQEDLARELKEVEASQLRFSEETIRQLRELREFAAEKLDEERQAREAQGTNLEDHVDFLEGFLQDARELFLQRGARHRRVTAKGPNSPMPRPRI